MKTYSTIKESMGIKSEPIILKRTGKLVNGVMRYIIHTKTPGGKKSKVHYLIEYENGRYSKSW